MMKIVVVGIISAIVIIYLKSTNNELANLALIMSGIIIVSMVLDYVLEVFSFFNEVVELTGIENSLYKIVFKVTAIGYLFEFGASTVEDFGFKSLSSKLIFAGKVIILVTALPIIYAVLNLLTSILK